MPGARILYDDWKDYDNRKIRDNRNNSTFSCEEQWEVSYLVSKIRKHHAFPEAAIRDAISACCMEVKVPRLREEFVHCVMQKLGSSGS